jgi:hypothetical protein
MIDDTVVSSSGYNIFHALILGFGNALPSSHA